MSQSLSYPQHIFLNELNTKFRAFVGGFGCVHPDTKVWTSRGLVRISDISEPTPVLSWNQKGQKFQFSLSGGSFPKGKANLYRASTPRGEFVSTGHHQIFSSGHKYQPISRLVLGDSLLACERDLLSSIAESGQLSSILDVGNWNQIDADCLANYADAARRYGQSLLMAQDNGQENPPLSVDAHKLSQYCDPPSFLHEGGREELKLAHIRPYQFCVPPYMSDLPCLAAPLGLVSAGRIFSSFFERISDYLQESKQFLLRFLRRHIIPLFVSRARSSSFLETVEINNIEDLGEEVYWDMQVLDTNNYVDEYGFIHHNSGKTAVGCIDLILFAARHPRTIQGYFGPTYPSIRDIFFPTMEEMAHIYGFTAETKEANKEVHLYRGRAYYGTIICRSMDRPESIVGFKIARALVDEIDTLPKDKATRAWNKIVARLRLVIPGVQNGIGVTTTPEGFLFVYEKFANHPTQSYSMVQASTYENQAYLPDDYIDSLLETYPDELIQAYLMGEFVNLKSGTVYNGYDRIANRSKEAIQEKEPLYIGMDFNVTNMSAVVYVHRGEIWHAVDELKGIYDTPAMIQTIEERYKEHHIRIYPDASGKSRKTVNASISDISLLEQAGFAVYANASNPLVKDRVLSANAAFSKKLVMVNDEKCPEYARCLEQLAYDDNGEPDKKSNLDHLPDAGTYPIAFEMPINRPAVKLDLRYAR